MSAVQSPSPGGRWRVSCLNPTELGSVPFHRDLRQLSQYYLSSPREENILTWSEGVYRTSREWHASSLPDNTVHYVAWNFGHRSQ